MDQVEDVASDDAQDNAVTTVKGGEQLSVHPVAAMFGPYTEHPVAALFPLLRDTDENAFTELVCSIRDVGGQIDPIVLDGNVILDGRNRYLACVAAGVEPKVVQFADLAISMSAHEYAFERNYTRRHLTNDQRTAITAAFLRFDADEVKRMKAEAGKQGAPHGKQGGRGHTKPLVTDSSQGVSSVKPKRAPSTRKKVADAAGVSEHKAQQAINIEQRGSSELKEAVRDGTLSLAQAHSQLQPGSDATDGSEMNLSDASATVAKVTKKPKVSHKDRFNKAAIKKRAVEAARIAAAAVKQTIRDHSITGEAIREAFASELVKKLASHLRLSVTHPSVTDRGQPEKTGSAGPLH